MIVIIICIIITSIIMIIFIITIIIIRSYIWLKSLKSLLQKRLRKACESGCHMEILLKAALHSLQSVYILNSLNFPENILNSLQSVHIFRIVTGT